jgi:hypothetical protein
MMVPIGLTFTDGAIATIIAALVAAIVSLFTLWLAGRRADRNRRRENFAQAFAAVVAYREYPFAVRRRRPDIPADERVRLSEALRSVQRELAFHKAWVAVEARPETAAEYEELVKETRRVAGGYIRDAWNRPAAQTDTEMNIDDIDYAELLQLEQAFLDRVRDEV